MHLNLIGKHIEIEGRKGIIEQITGEFVRIKVNKYNYIECTLDFILEKGKFLS